MCQPLSCALVLSSRSVTRPAYLFPSTAQRGLPRLLLIDDEPDSYDIFRRILVRAGIRYQIDYAPGGEEGIRYLDKCQQGGHAWPALLFLDIKMPVMNGFDVLTLMQSRGMLGKIVVAMLSSSSEPKDVGRAFGLGAHHYIAKEAGTDLIAQLVRSAMLFAPVKSASLKA